MKIYDFKDLSKSHNYILNYTAIQYGALLLRSWFSDDDDIITSVYLYKIIYIYI